MNDKITPSEVGPLITEAYKSMGINYNPSVREIKAWLKQVDRNHDGDVDLEEFLDLVKSNLIKAGIYSEN